MKLAKCHAHMESNCAFVLQYPRECDAITSFVQYIADYQLRESPDVEGALFFILVRRKVFHGLPKRVAYISRRWHRILFWIGFW